MHMLMIWLSWPPLFSFSDRCWNAVNVLPPHMVWNSTLLRHNSSSFLCMLPVHPHPYTKFCGLPLEFSNTVVQLGSILSSDLSDSEDIILHKCRDMVTKFNALLRCFPNLDPTILTNLFQSYCLSFHGSALWNISSRSLQSLEVSFNKVLHRIWKLPHASHTAGLQSFQPSSSTLQQTDLLSWECSSNTVRHSSVL